MLKALNRLAALILIISLGAHAQSTQNTAVYLDYEEHVIAAYLLLAAGQPIENQDQIIQRAIKHASEVQKKGVLEVNVKSFEEFLKRHRGEWPNAHSVEANLEVIENSEIRPMTYIYSDNPQVQKQIVSYHANRFALLRQKYPNIMPLIQSYRNAIVTGSVALPLLVEQMRALFAQHSGPFIQGQFQKISSLGKELLNRQGGKNQTDSFNIFISFAIAEYFQNLSLNSQKQIISQMLADDLMSDPIRKFEIMVLNSGPQFQKLLQVVAREASLPEDMLVVFKRLESLTMPVHPYFVRRIMQPEFANYDILQLNEKPLGVGTMAQVHKAEIRYANNVRQAVIRFIKPDIEKRVLEDHQILMILAPILDAKPELAKSGFSKIGPLAEELTQTVLDELDVSATIERQKLGRTSYNRMIHLDSVNREMLIRVPQIYESKYPGSKIMVQEFVTGMKIDKLQERHQTDMPHLKKELTLKLTEVWLSVLLFENGVYHSDLHQGNIMVDMGQRVLPFNLLDFGMAGQLSQSERQYFLMMAAGGELSNAKMMAEAMYGLSSQARNDISEKEFTELVEIKMQSLKDQKKIMSPERWLGWGLMQGLRFPTDIVGVGRGFTILDKLLKEANAGTTILNISRKLAIKHKWKVLSTLRQSENFRFLDILLTGHQILTSGRVVDHSAFEQPSQLAPMCRSVILAR